MIIQLRNLNQERRNEMIKMTNKQKKNKLLQEMKKDKDLKPYVKDIKELNTKSFSIFLKIAKSLKQ